MASFEFEVRQRGVTPRDARGRFVSVRSVDQVYGSLTGIAEAMIGASLDASAGAVIELAEETLGLAQEYVPVDETTLQNSGRVQVEESDDSFRATVGFGSGAAAGYAAYIHETPDKMFSAETQLRRARQGRGYKFLERAGQEIAEDALDRIAESIDARLTGGSFNGDSA